MPAFNLDKLAVPDRPRRWSETRLWREWCFARVVFHRFRVLILVMALLLLGGATAFVVLEREKHHSISQGIYFTWSLIFGEPPEEFPEHVLLQTLFFLVPVVGMIVILEGILEFAFMVRDRRKSERSWCLTMAQSLKDHIVLVGIGRLGYRTFLLLRKLGETVVVVERDANNQFIEEIRRDGSPLFICDARREAILADANISQARSIILASDDDLANLEVALDARRINPQIRVVMRMFDQNMADKIREGFGIQIAMSPSAIGAPTFAMAAAEASVMNSQVVNDELVVTERWFVREHGPLWGMTVGDVLSKFSFGIVERRPKAGEPRLFPPPDTRLLEGDELIVQGAYDRLISLRKESIRPI